MLVVGISFVLAYRSMRDYQEIPQKSDVEYGLFLVRQTENFDVNFLDSIRNSMLNENLIVSLERLFKGTKTALTIFGPKKILGNFIQQLKLLELEDYTSNLNSANFSAWEIGVKNNQNTTIENPNNIFSSMPELRDEEQFFWQVVLGATSKDSSFQTQIRAVLYCEDQDRKKVLIPLFQNLNENELIKIPKPFSTEQMMSFFISRSLAKDSRGPILNAAGVVRLLRV